MRETVAYAREELPRTADVVVGGGGIVGAATAFWLARAGRRPLLVERAPALASATSAHCVRAQFAEPENIAMMRESLSVFADFPAVLGLPPAAADIGRRPEGYLRDPTDYRATLLCA